MFAISMTQLQSFKTIFLSITLEAFPFILIGVIVSSFLQVFVPDRLIQKLVPKSPLVGVLAGALLGIPFPLCECGMIPVVHRLIRKGMPVYIGITYILAGPIINPVVYASTTMAFRSLPELIWLRMGLAFAAAITTGLLLRKLFKQNVLRHPAAYGSAHDDHNHHHADSEHHHSTAASTFSSKLPSAIRHISDEFFTMGKYLLFGCLLTAAFQVFVSRELLISIGEGMSSHLFMAGFAYLLSICSTSDAFIASSFIGTFSAGSLLTFMVFGPMLDLKNTIVLLSVFKARFVTVLCFLVLGMVLAGSFLIDKLLL